MWGGRTNYFILSFLSGITISKINSCILEIPYFSATTYIAISCCAVITAFLFLISHMYIRKYTEFQFITINMCTIFVLGYCSHQCFNFNNITIESDILNECRITLLNKLNIFPDTFSCYIKAFLLGDKSCITIESKKMFIKTGTLHLFALSGLHAGIVYSVLYFIMHPIKLIFRQKWIHTVIILLILLIYSLITGGGASVMRASSMIAVFLYNKYTFRLNGKVSTLLLAAFFITLYSPESMFEVGFQLSFTAMIGIIYIFPYLSRCIKKTFNNKILKWIFNLISISLACQIATFPVSIYYFGEISEIFLLGNLVAVPTVTFIIYLSLFAIIISPIKWLFEAFCFVLNILFEVLLQIINFLAN